MLGTLKMRWYRMENLAILKLLLLKNLNLVQVGKIKAMNLATTNSESAVSN